LKGKPTIFMKENGVYLFLVLGKIRHLLNINLDFWNGRCGRRWIYIFGIEDVEGGGPSKHGVSTNTNKSTK